MSDRRCVSLATVDIPINTDQSAHESADPEALADIAFSDERTDQETGQSQLVVTSRSESATGREREQVNNFTFDKVRSSDITCSII